ncbi:MAG: alpha/beta hydrolase [Candidatus Eisenbacteria bacterium]
MIVHVHGLGVEQITLYRQETLAARAAAAAGYPAFRYHARGCGDSAGDSASITLTTLVEDARAAAEEAKRRSGASRVLWLGVRFGAIVAALAAARRTDTVGFVFWEPIAKSMDQFRGQLRGMLFSSVAGGKKPDSTVEQLLERIARDGGVDVHGYILYRELVESCRDVDLASALVAAGEHPVQLLQVQQRGRLAPQHAKLLEALAARGVKTGSACITEEPGYQLMSNPAWQSDPLTRATLEAFRALA